MLYDEDKTTIVVILGILTLTALLLFILSGCATTEMEVKPNGVISWKSTTFLKNVKDADVQWGTFHARLGSSFGDHETVTAVSGSLMQSVIDTGQITLQGGTLIDTLGRPRAATAAEIAAQYQVLENLNAAKSD